MESLDGRKIIVTGGASGMGAGLVLGLARRGGRIFSLDLNDEAGRAVVRDAGAEGFAPVDVAEPESVRSAVDRAITVLGGLDVLIHAAGIAPAARAEQTGLDLWNRAIAVNATGTMLMNQAVFPHLKGAGGSILNFASDAGVRGYPGKSAYAAAKGAVVAWVRSIAVEWAPYGITVNAIAPAIWTPMYDKTRSEMSVEQRADHDRALARAIPIGGRLGDIESDFLPVMAFLASPGSRFVTGQVIPIDGGLLMMR